MDMVESREADDESCCTCEKLNMLVAPGSSMVAAIRPAPPEAQFAVVLMSCLVDTA